MELKKKETINVQNKNSLWNNVHFALLCVFMWVFSAIGWMNLLSQTEHASGRSPVCVMAWCFNVSALPNDRSQCGHGYALTPRWTTFMWRFIFAWRVNTTEQRLHGYWTSSLWYFMCARSSWPVVFRKPHVGQTKFLIPSWRIVCSFNLYFVANILEQILHLNGVSFVCV